MTDQHPITPPPELVEQWIAEIWHEGTPAPGPAQPLSPAAQAVLRADAGARCVSEWDSVNDPPCHPSDSNWNGCFDCVNRSAVAAALRAAADLVPDHQMSAHMLHAIADELENQ